MTVSERRYDMDWLRVIAIGLLLLYHIGIGFQPWGVFIGFIQNDNPLEALWIPMTMINIWRIPLLFFVSGMGVSFALRKRNWKQLLSERAGRILTPFVFGLLFIVPLHSLIWQKYYHQDIIYNTGPGHLWFLANIFIYVIVLLPSFIFLKNNIHGKVISWLNILYTRPVGLLVITSAFVLEALRISKGRFLASFRTRIVLVSSSSVPVLSEGLKSSLSLLMISPVTMITVSGLNRAILSRRWLMFPALP